MEVIDADPYDADMEDREGREGRGEEQVSGGDWYLDLLEVDVAYLLHVRNLYKKCLFTF